MESREKKKYKKREKSKSKSKSRSRSREIDSDSSSESNKDIIKTNSEITILLDTKKRLTIRKFKSKLLVDIREFYESEGEMRPGKKGIALSIENWQKIKKHINDIDSAIENMK